ncbi:MAG: TolC family protein [Bacteroidetes bacterium]|nr:TolC family protein [Bacteroidota bacterium]
MRAQIKLIMMLVIAGQPAISSTAQDGILDEYIRIGLENNIAIQKSNLSYQKDLAVMQEARGYFLPGLSFHARYTIARGGRTFEFPAGDMLNPLFQNITALNTAMAAINPMYPSLPAYPSADNIIFKFYRPTEHETKFSLIQPLFNPAIYYNYRIKQVETEIGLTGIEITGRNLVKQITDAYYDYLRSHAFDRLADEVIVLATENLRVCNSLYVNNMITSDIVLRAEADLAGAGVTKSETTGAINSSQAMFNYLLKRDLREPIIRDTSIVTVPGGETLAESISLAPSRRPETALIDKWLEANRHFISLTRTDALPVVAGAVDYGFQGEKYSFGKDDDFLLASVVLRWNISAGNTARSKTRQAKIDREMLELNREELESQIELQVTTAYYDLNTAFEAAEAATRALEPAIVSFGMARARFREGEVSYAGMLEAQTMMIKAKQQLLDRQYLFMKKKAAYNLATGNTTIK